MERLVDEVQTMYMALPGQINSQDAFRQFLFRKGIVKYSDPETRIYFCNTRWIKLKNNNPIRVINFRHFIIACWARQRVPKTKLFNKNTDY
jgi:hypothetical protein